MKKKKTSDFAMTIKLAFDIDGGAFLPDDGSPWSFGSSTKQYQAEKLISENTSGISERCFSQSEFTRTR